MKTLGEIVEEMQGEGGDAEPCVNRREDKIKALMKEYALVPREPTKKQVYSTIYYPQYAKEVYRAMIKAGEVK